MRCIIWVYDHPGEHMRVDDRRGSEAWATSMVSRAAAPCILLQLVAAPICVGRQYCHVAMA